MLSVIIPVYNAENYLKKCIESIRVQTYENIEIILIDDGSIDKSPQICDNYATIDKRIRVVHKKNGGVSSARNKGLEIANGEFIMFVDSDDWIKPDLCESLLNQADQVDFIVGGYTMIGKSGNQENLFIEEIFNYPEQLGEKFDLLYSKNFFNAPFSKVYKRNIIANQRFDTSVALGEDFLFNLEYVLKCKKIKASNTAGYNYNCLNEGAATKKLRENDVDQIIRLYQCGKNFLNEYCPKAHESKELKERFCINGVNLIQLICYSDKTKKEKKVLARKLITNSEFVSVCQEEYSFPFKYNFPKKLCARGSWINLQIFFWIKKKISKISNR